VNKPIIIRQDGRFFLFGVNGERKRCAIMRPEWIKDPIVILAGTKSPYLKSLTK
jgi:hypothetical protein